MRCPSSLLDSLLDRARLLGLLCAQLGAFGAAGCGGTVHRPDGGFGLLPPGMVAPEVVAYDGDDREVRLSALRGHPVVVYFYPKDGSPYCTREACAFRDAWTQYASSGVFVLGVSSDSRESHMAFQREHRLPFALAPDPSGAVAHAYGVPTRLWGDDRRTFLVDRTGRVARVWTDVDPGVHAAEVLREAQRIDVEPGADGALPAAGGASNSSSTPAR